MRFYNSICDKYPICAFMPVHWVIGTITLPSVSYLMLVRLLCYLRAKNVLSSCDFYTYPFSCTCLFFPKYVEAET